MENKNPSDVVEGFNSIYETNYSLQPIEQFKRVINETKRPKWVCRCLNLNKTALIAVAEDLIGV